MTEPREDGYADWLTAAAPSVRDFGWDRHLMMDELGGGLSVAMLDVLPPQDVEIAVEGPPTFSISLFVEGEGSISIDGGQPLRITPGVVVVCSTDRTIAGTNKVNGGVRLRLVDIRFDPEMLSQIGGPVWRADIGGMLTDRSMPDLGALMIGFPATPALLLAARQMLDCSFRREDIRRLYLRAKALEVLAIVIALFWEARERETGAQVRLRRKVAEAQGLIEARPQEPWTITRLAKAVSLNEKTLKAGFRSQVGQPIHAYLITVRIEAASAMLRAGHSVTDVALASGFSNLSHFSKTFRKATGIAPRDYAKDTAQAGGL
ncbi:AraC family transcriptional regulator [Azorhizobium oxalatiphilum]|uniref:AraC family transcriptional regulator n=1 Tax=Azorhizobium oxalatiphilum TaxID=980631 RepID=A0A917C5I7_9HYPH|nr:helix-turn-helix transcriptional regulator [Azorhizobium oxalatiphilum]GGF70005.1 AraC family transcriptional regulator [Azorhizobium oxalatiphilum]